MKTITRIISVTIIMSMAAIAQTLDLSDAKTMQTKGDTPNTAQIVTDFDGQKAGSNIASYVKEQIREGTNGLPRPPVLSVNSQTGNVSITAQSIGAATPSGVSNAVKSAIENIDRIYNPTNRLEWYEIHGDEQWTYSVITTSNSVWSYHCDNIYYGETLLAEAQSGTFSSLTPPVTPDKLTDGYYMPVPIIASGSEETFRLTADVNGTTIQTWTLNHPIGYTLVLDSINNNTGYFYRSNGNVEIQYIETVSMTATNITVKTIASNDDLAKATNNLVQTYFLGTNAFLVISNNMLSIERTDNGTNNTILWSQPQVTSVDPSTTQQLWTVINNLQSQINAINSTSAWGNYAPDGSENPDPSYMVYVNTPALMHASGFQWATSGGHSVLATAGTVAFASGSSGEMRIGPDLTTNYFGFVRGGAITVGSEPGGISVTGAGTAEGVAIITFAYEGGGFPVLWFAASLDVPFTEMSGVVWQDNADGTATVTAPATTAKGFWYATSTSSSAAYFFSNMPAKLEGGVFGATNQPPVRFDSTATFTGTDGHVYRLPAKFVE